MHHLKICIATFFYLGFIPFASGTWGTLGAVALCFLFWYIQFTDWYELLFVIILTSLATYWSGNYAEKYFATKDPKCVVMDEVAGFFVTIFLFQPSWTVIITGFILFRFFDIVKPFPIKKIQALPGGFGILVDDWMAGIYASACLLLFTLLSSYVQWPLDIQLFWISK